MASEEIMKGLIGLGNKALDKIPIDKVYEDLLQPSLKEAGECLRIVFQRGTVKLLPWRLKDEMAKMDVKYALELYQKKLDRLAKQNLCTVPEYIGLPILESLTYITQEELRNGFLNLLTKASSTETIGMAHPSFLTVLHNISADEAKILNHYKDSSSIPFIDMPFVRTKKSLPKPAHWDEKRPKTREEMQLTLDYQNQELEPTELRFAYQLTGIESFLNIDFKDQVDVYVENLLRLGLIEFERTQYLATDEEIYEKLEKQVYEDFVSEAVEQATASNIENTDYDVKVVIKKGYIFFTEYGKAFIKACIRD